MGLDNFIDDDSGNSNQTNSSSNTTSNQEQKDNTPSGAVHGFHDLNDVSCRAIIQQTKHLSEKWKYHFSTERFDSGELVMYSAGVNVKKSGKTVMVFTTVQEVTSNDEPNERRDILVKLWDLDNHKAINEGVSIEGTKDWKKDLFNAIEDQLDKLDRRV